MVDVKNTSCGRLGHFCYYFPWGQQRLHVQVSCFWSHDIFLKVKDCHVISLSSFMSALDGILKKIKRVSGENESRKSVNTGKLTLFFQMPASK